MYIASHGHSLVLVCVTAVNVQILVNFTAFPGDGPTLFCYLSGSVGSLLCLCVFHIVFPPSISLPSPPLYATSQPGSSKSLTPLSVGGRLSRSSTRAGLTR